MKLTLNSIETLRYILSFVDNPQNSDKKRLLSAEKNKLRAKIEKKILPFITEKKKELNEYIKKYNTALLEKQRELSISKIRQELHQEKINEDETVKNLFTELQDAKTRIGEEQLEVKLSNQEKLLCSGLVKDWDKEIGWESGEDRVAEELLSNFK